MPLTFRTVLSNVVGWLLDYAYVARIVLGLVVKRHNAQCYDEPTEGPTCKSLEVVIIPGVFEDWRFMKPLADALHAAGHHVHVIESLKHNRGTVEDMARLTSEYVAQHVHGEYAVVAHSKGGLIGKYLLLHDTAAQPPIEVIAINTPFSGSVYAYLLPPLPSLKVFRPASPLLRELDRESSYNDRIVSVYARFDPHIPSGSYLRDAKNIVISGKGHFKILSNQELIRTVIDLLRHTP